MRKRATSIVAATRVTTTIPVPIDNFDKLCGLAIKESHGANECTQHACASSHKRPRARLNLLREGAAAPTRIGFWGTQRNAFTNAFLNPPIDGFFKGCHGACCGYFSIGVGELLLYIGKPVTTLRIMLHQLLWSKKHMLASRGVMGRVGRCGFIEKTFNSLMGLGYARIPPPPSPLNQIFMHCMQQSSAISHDLRIGSFQPHFFAIHGSIFGCASSKGYDHVLQKNVAALPHAGAHVA